MHHTDKHSTDVLLPIMREIGSRLASHGLVTWEKRRILIELLAEDAVDVARSWDYENGEWQELQRGLTRELAESLTENMREHLLAEKAAAAEDSNKD